MTEDVQYAPSNQTVYRVKQGIGNFMRTYDEQKKLCESNAYCVMPTVFRQVVEKNVRNLRLLNAKALFMRVMDATAYASCN